MMLDSMNGHGLSRELSLCDSAAKWTTTSVSRTSESTSSASATLPSTNADRVAEVGQALAVAGVGQGVQDGHLPVGPDVADAVDEVGADEAGASGDEDLHGWISLCAGGTTAGGRRGSAGHGPERRGQAGSATVRSPGARRRRPAVELDLEAEPVRQVAVVGQGDRAAVAGEREPAHQQQRRCRGRRRAGRRPASAATPAVMRLADRGDPVALPLQGLPDAGLGGVGAAEPAGQGGRHPLLDEVERHVVDGADRPAAQGLLAVGQSQARAHGSRRCARSRTTPPARDSCRPASATAEDACRNVPERQRLVERAAGDEPARALPALDQPLLAQQLQRAADGDPARAVPPPEHRLALEGAGLAEVAEGDALAHVVGDGPEPGTCHELVNYKSSLGQRGGCAGSRADRVACARRPGSGRGAGAAPLRGLGGWPRRC